MRHAKGQRSFHGQIVEKLHFLRKKLVVTLNFTLEPKVEVTSKSKVKIMKFLRFFFSKIIIRITQRGVGSS